LSKDTSELTAAQIATYLQEWILEESDVWNFKKIVQPHLLLNLEVKTSSGRFIHVQMDDIHERIYLIAKMGPSDIQQKAFGLIPPLEKKRFIANLMVSLYNLGIEAAKEQKLQINLQKFIYFDELTKDKFFECLFTIWRGIETIQALYDSLPDIPVNNHTLQ
jgi:hypothetical protein